MASAFDKNPGNQLNSEVVLKESSDYFGKSLRTIDSRSVVNQYYTHFRASYDGNDNPTEVNYYRGTTPHVTTVYTQPASGLSGKYFILYSAPNVNKYVVWFNVDGLSVQPVVSGAYEYIEVPVLSSDTASIVATAIMIMLNTSYSSLFTVNKNSTDNVIGISTAECGETTDSDAGNTTFFIENEAGTQALVQNVVIEYDGQDPLYQGEVLVGYSYDIYAGKFIKNPEVISYAKSPDGELVIDKESGTVSSNSTTTPLLAGGSFTGAWVDASQYSCISWTVNSDVDSAVNGMRLQFSHDGTNIIRQSATNFTGSANGVFFSFPVHAKYFRIYFENGAVNQTRFYLDTQLHEEYNGLAAIPLDTPLNDKSSATTVKSIISGKSVDGIYVNQRADGVSTLNSTTALLGSGATFTGPWEEVLGYANISIVCFSDVDSATDGLKLEYSTNGIDTDDFDSYTTTGGNGSQYTSGSTAKYFRIRYTNGATPQSEFRLQTVYHITAPKPSTHRIDDSINGQNDAELMKAVLTGKNPDGNFTNSRNQGVLSSNSTITLLDANETYRGTWFKWSEDYTSAISILKSDVSGTLYLDASQEENPLDGVDTDVSFFVELPYDPSVFPVLRRNTPLQSKWARHRYVNGSAAQGEMHLTCVMTIVDPGDTYTEAAYIPSQVTFVGHQRSIQTIANAAGDGYQDVPVDSVTGNPKVTVSNVRDDILLKPLSVPLATQFTIGTTATRIDPTQLSNRRAVMISNDGSTSCSIGFSDDLTFDSASFRLPAGETRSLMFSEAVQLWAIAQNTGGVQSTLQRSGASASGTATNVNNALTSNDLYANVTAAAQTVSVTGFTAGTANSLVSVRLGCEANRNAGGTQVIAHVATVTGSAGNVGTVSTSAPVVAVTNQLYLAAVSRESTALVTGITGLGLGWTQIGTISNGGARTIDVWKAQGTVTSDSVVTASFSATATNSHIAVSRYSGVDTTSPIQASNTATGSTDTPITASLASTANGMVYMAVAMDSHVSTPGAGYTEISDEVTPSGGNRDGLTTEIKPITVTGTETPTCTLDGSAAWAALGLTINPALITEPTVTLSYTLSAVPGATSGVLTISSTVDTTQYVDITSDRAWVVGDIANIAAIVTGTSATTTVNVDWIFVELVDTTGNTTRLSVLQGAEAIV